MVEWGPENQPAKNPESILSYEFVDAVMEGARHNLVTHGSLATTLFLQLEGGEKGMVLLSLPENDNGKRLYFTILGLSIKESGRQIREAILVPESWYVQTSQDSPLPLVSPEDHPARKEAITLEGRDNLSQRFIFAIQPFHRDFKSEPVFEPLLMGHYHPKPGQRFYTTGLLNNLFPEISVDHFN